MPMRYAIHNGASGVLKGYLTDDGTAGGNPIVVDEPTIVRKINDGLATIRLTLSVRLWSNWAAGRSPVPLDDSGQILAWFDVIEVQWPDGTVAGRFIFETYDFDGSHGDNTIIELAHVVVDLQDTDCDALSNWTVVDRLGAPGRGLKDFGYTVTAEVPRTKHCTNGTVVNNGVSYALDYTHSKIRQVLDNAINLGGPDFWWYCDPAGVVTVSNGDSGIHWIDSSQVLWVKEHGSISQAYNVQQMSGAVDSVMGGSGLPIQSVRETTSGFWSTTAVGRKLAPPYADPSIADLGTLNQLGDTILARSQTNVATLTVRTVGAVRLHPGNKVVLVAPYGDGSTAYWVTQVSEEGSTGVQELALASQFGGYRANATPATQPFLDNLMSGLPWGGTVGSTDPGGAAPPATLQLRAVIYTQHNEGPLVVAGVGDAYGPLDILSWSTLATAVLDVAADTYVYGWVYSVGVHHIGYQTSPTSYPFAVARMTLTRLSGVVDYSEASLMTDTTVTQGWNKVPFDTGSNLFDGAIQGFYVPTAGTYLVTLNLNNLGYTTELPNAWT